jgi:carbonic anhydrase
VQKEVLAALARGQRPSATIIGCSDSRVPPELVFDAGFGELFIIRIAGNVISPEVMGTIQYAAVHLHTPLFVVLGHEGCGAVTAAVAMKEQGARERAHISVLLDGILPGLPNPDAALTDEEQLAAAVEANVRWSMHQLLDTPEGQARMAEGIVKLVGAVYELKTGRVRFLP